MAATLKVIRDGSRSAAFNMAADRYLLEQAAAGAAAFLRLYSWEPPAVSLGWMQKPDVILDEKALTEENVEWVVRPTGGRAVLHMDDLTYAFVFPQAMEDLGTTVNQSYAVISRCLMRGLMRAGISCASHDSAAEYSATKRQTGLPCFLSPNRHEIMVGGRKLVGSAQKRTAGAVLQHGSIPLDGSFRRLPEFLAVPAEERARQRALLEKKCTCIREIKPSIDGNGLALFLIQGFAETLRFSVTDQSWRETELKDIGTRAHEHAEHAQERS